MSIPKHTKQWRVEGNNGFESLKLFENQDIGKIGDKEVLIKVRAVSINFRDILITQGRYPLSAKPSVIPGSDGAGTVIAVGPHVTRFKKGDAVVTLFNQGHIGGTLDQYSVKTGLGGSIDGTLREYAIFDENGLVQMPNSLTFLEASTLTCAGLTAWNALFGQSFEAIKIDGVITMIGFLGGEHRTPDEPTFMQPLAKMCTVRGLLVGSREQMENMCRAVDANKIRPVVDKQVFPLDRAKEAFEYMFAQKQLGKVCVAVDSDL